MAIKFNVHEKDKKYLKEASELLNTSVMEVMYHNRFRKLTADQISKKMHYKVVSEKDKLTESKSTILKIWCPADVKAEMDRLQNTGLRKYIKIDNSGPVPTYTFELTEDEIIKNISLYSSRTFVFK